MNKIYDVKERSYLYALEVIRFLERLPRNYIVSVLGKQLLRSGTSIGANIIEARAAGSRKEFINFYRYSLKSANESKFWLLLLRDSKLAEIATVGGLIKETGEIASILAAIILKMEGK